MDNDCTFNNSSLLSLESVSIKRRNILSLGTPGVGKSALAMRFKGDVFLESYEPTLYNTIRKIHKYNDTKVSIEINDIDGQTEYTILSYNKFSYGINGYLLIYSIENRDSFEKLKIINSKLDALIGKKVPKVVIGNKSDLDKKREVSRDEGNAFANGLNCPFIETSAKCKVNVDLMISLLLTEINRNENVFDEKQLLCFSCFKFIITKEQLFKKIILLMAIINAIVSISILIYQVSELMGTNENVHKINNGIMILYSLLSILMPGIVLIAYKNKSHRLYFIVTMYFLIQS